MHLLQSGVPFNVIALWLGHESMNTTHRYVEAMSALVQIRAYSPVRRRRHPSASTLGASAVDLQHMHIVAIYA